MTLGLSILLAFLSGFGSFKVYNVGKPLIGHQRINDMEKIKNEL